MTTVSTLPETDLIDAGWLARALATRPDVRILDVRTAGEFSGVHIPGSFNVPLDTLGEHARDLADVEHPVVLVCQSGSRAAQAHRHLSTAGKNTIHILDGGMSAWQAAGGEVVTASSSRWAMDRQVRLVAGSLALAGLTMSTVVPRAKWLAGAVGAGLTFSAITNTCAMAVGLAKLPYNRGGRCDIDGVITALNAQAA